MSTRETGTVKKVKNLSADLQVGKVKHSDNKQYFFVQDLSQPNNKQVVVDESVTYQFVDVDDDADLLLPNKKVAVDLEENP